MTCIQYSSKSWCIIRQGMFALQEINHLERETLLPGVAAGGIEGGLRVCRVKGWYRVVVDHGPSMMKGMAQATIPPTDEVLLSETSFAQGDSSW